MKSTRFFGTRFALTCGAFASLIVTGGGHAIAAPVTFTLDPARSSLTVTPSAVVLPNIFSRQVDSNNPSADSYVTSYSGSLLANVTANSFQLLPSSTISADEVNNWTPGTDFTNYVPNGPPPDGYIEVAEPAAYGLVQDFTGSGFGNGGLASIAIRNLALSLQHALPRTIVNGEFSDAGATAALVYDAPYESLIYLSVGGKGKSGGPTTDTDTVFPVMFDAAGDALLQSSGNLLTLTLPVGFNIPVSVYNYRFEGVITATAVVPEPNCLVLASTMALGFVLNRRGRKNSGGF